MKEEDMGLINFINYLDTEFNIELNAAIFEGKEAKFRKEQIDLLNTFGPPLS